MEKIQIFFQLTRLNKPIGILLLFWPCSWGLSLGYYFNPQINLYLKHMILFFLGAVLMRSAGCIFNDIIDRDLDKKVERTKNRPIASGKVSVLESLVYVTLLCLLSLLILLQFNFMTVLLGMSSMILAFAYPFMKRITYWPQLFLGLTFNWGIIMGWVSLTNSISIEPFILYFSAIFWTLGYDTIYGLQDIKDDEIIGVKSTSIKFKKNVKLFIGASYLISILFILILAIKINAGIFFHTFLLLVFMHFVYQIKFTDKDTPNTCLKMFKSNNWVGLVVCIMILTLNIV